MSNFERRRNASAKNELSRFSKYDMDAELFFDLHFNEELVELMVPETNRYAVQVQEQESRRSTRKRHTRLSTWKPINNEDMRKFIGILLLM